MVDEIREGRGLSVLLAHEQERHARRAQDEHRSEAQARGVDQAGQPLAAGPVASVVVVEREDHETPGFDADRRRAVAAPAVRRVLALVAEALADGPGKLVDLAEVAVVAEPLAGEHGVEGVVEVVVPLRGPSRVPRRARGDHLRVVVRTLGDQPQRAASTWASSAVASASSAKKGVAVGRRSVDGIQAQAVEAEVAEPREGVLDEVAPHRVRRRPVDVDRLAPWRGVAVRE